MPVAISKLIKCPFDPSVSYPLIQALAWWCKWKTERKKCSIQSTSSPVHGLSISLFMFIVVRVLLSFFVLFLSLNRSNCFVWVSLFIDFSLCVSVCTVISSLLCGALLHPTKTYIPTNIHTYARTRTHTKHEPNDCCNAFFLYIMYIVSCSQNLVYRV